MKSAVYFPIDANNSSTTKSAEIIMNYGYSGYGIYIVLLQKLVSSKTRTLELSKIKAIAFDMHVNVDELHPIIDTCFDVDRNANIFYSEELNERMQWFDDKYNKASEGGKKAADNMTPEQRIERARNAGKKSAEVRKTSSNALDKSNNELTPTNHLDEIQLMGKLDEQTPLDDSTNNKIKENRIEKNKTEENKKEETPSGFSNPVSGLDSDLFFKDVLTISNVQKIYNDFIKVVKEGNKMSVLQFEKILIYYYSNSVKSYYEEKGLSNLMTKALLIDIINSYDKVKPNVEFDGLDKLIKKTKSDSNVMNDFNLTIDRFKLPIANENI